MSSGPSSAGAVDDALGGYVANYEAARRAGQIDGYYLFPGSKMRMPAKSGPPWTVRA